MHDVIVVGAGPAGGYAAFAMAAGGLDVVVVEEHKVVGEPVDCCGVIGTEAFDVPGVSRDAILGGISSIRLVPPSGVPVAYRSPRPVAYVVNRAAFDRKIAEKAIEAGSKIVTGARVLDVAVGRDGVEATIANGGGREKLRAQVAVLAGGPTYAFQERLGLGKPPQVLRTAQVEVPMEGFDAVHAFFGRRYAPESFAWAVPFRVNGTAMVRIGASAGANPVHHLRELLTDPLFGDRPVGEEPRIRSWIIPVAPIRRSFGDRVLAVGDAAGQVKPTTGGGIYYGILCARLAAQTVVEAFRAGRFDRHILGRYESRWRRKIGLELLVGRVFRRIFARLSDVEIDQFFGTLRSSGLLEGLSGRAQFDWHRDLILAVLRTPALGRIFLKHLVR